MRRIILIFSLILVPLISNGQISYIIKAGKASYQLDIQDRGDIKNCKSCRILKDGQIIEYSPDELSEYQIPDGDLYVSRLVDIDGQFRRVFMRRLRTGDLDLYYYRSKDQLIFALEKDSTTRVQLDPRMDEDGGFIYRKQLKELLYYCPNSVYAIDQTRYRRNSMGRLMDFHNRCAPGYFAFARLGFNIGYAASILKSSSFMIYEASTLHEEYIGGLAAGVFAELPLYFSEFSLYTELNYMQHEYRYYGGYFDREQYYLADSKMLTLPLNIRMAFSAGKNRLYFMAGPEVAWQFEHSDILYQSRVQGIQVSSVVLANNQLLSEFLFGGNLGCGFEFSLPKRKAIYIDFRLNGLDSLLEEDRFFQKSIMIRSGYSF